MDKAIVHTVIEKFVTVPSVCSPSPSAKKRRRLKKYTNRSYQIGFMKRTPQGRVATPLAYKHGLAAPQEPQRRLFDNFAPPDTNLSV